MSQDEAPLPKKALTRQPPLHAPETCLNPPLVARTSMSAKNAARPSQKPPSPSSQPFLTPLHSSKVKHFPQKRCTRLSLPCSVNNVMACTSTERPCAKAETPLNLTTHFVFSEHVLMYVIRKSSKQSVSVHCPNRNSLKCGCGWYVNACHPLDPNSIYGDPVRVEIFGLRLEHTHGCGGNDKDIN